MRNFLKKFFLKGYSLFGLYSCQCPQCDFDITNEDFTPYDWDNNKVFDYEVTCPVCDTVSVWDFQEPLNPVLVKNLSTTTTPPYNPILPHNVQIGDVSDGYHTFNELYEHRHLLFCLATKNPGLKSWRAKFHDDGSAYSGYFIAGIHLPAGDITYHLPYEYWELLNHAETYEKAPTWDGHTSSDVVDRIRVFLQS